MCNHLVSKGASLTGPGFTAKTHAVALLSGMPYKVGRPTSIASMFECVTQLGYNLGSVLDNTRQTLLHSAAQLHDTDLARVFLSLGASLLIKAQDGHIALHAALASKREISRRARTLDMFLERDQREQLDSQEKEGRTALHRVLADSDTSTAAKLAQYLLARGSDVLAKDHHGNIPLNVAIRNQGAESDLQTLLRARRREQLPSKGLDGQTPLQIALALGPGGEHVVEELLNAGAQDHRTSAMS
jgi:ankyrin repeat protein